MRNAFRNIIIVLLVIVLSIVIFLNMRIQNVKVQGNTIQSDVEIVSKVFSSEIEKSPIVFFLRDKFNKHKKIEYIDKYTVKWLNPLSVVITVSEKPAIAYVRNDLKNVYFDRDGIINEVTSERKVNVIEVSGINFKSYEKGEMIETKDMKLMNAILDITRNLNDNNLPAEFLDVDKDGKISVSIGNIVVKLGNIRNMEIKLQRLNDIYKEIKDLSGVLSLENASENMLDEEYIFRKNN